jgi:hypothetical protein
MMRKNSILPCLGCITLSCCHDVCFGSPCCAPCRRKLLLCSLSQQWSRLGQWGWEEVVAGADPGLWPPRPRPRTQAQKKLDLLRSVAAHRQTLKTNPSHASSRTGILPSSPARPAKRRAPSRTRAVAACGGAASSGPCGCGSPLTSHLVRRPPGHTPSARPASARHSLFMV